MKVTIYFDIQGWETEQGHIYPFTQYRTKDKDKIRYAVTVEIPDPVGPDVVLKGELAQDV
jgi:hypothetical protein